MSLVDTIDHMERGPAFGPWLDSPPAPAEYAGSEPTATLDRAAEVALAPAVSLYVSTDLRTWVPDGPERYAKDIEVDDVLYRRLDLAYYAWLRYRVGIVMRSYDAGRVSDQVFEEITARFAGVYEWAAGAFEEEAMQKAYVEFDPRGYEPPKPLPRVVDSPGHFPGSAGK